MNQLENHWAEISGIETGLQRKMTALGLDWHDEATMTLLAAECKAFNPAEANAAFASKDRARITKAEIFALVSLMLRAMEDAAMEGREVHGGEAWKALSRHLYI